VSSPRIVEGDVPRMRRYYFAYVQVASAERELDWRGVPWPLTPVLVEECRRACAEVREPLRPLAESVRTTLATLR
jgi:hypothetical protein